jgi:Serine dehydrogenase proteinase
MARKERKALIKKLQEHRESRVITYITGDRPPVTAQIADDAIRPLYEHIREIGHVPKLDLFIYSRGGATDVPWRIVNALRNASDTWEILVPFRANSAATMIALGADKIIMGQHGELGPIDPTISMQRVMGLPGGGQPTVVQDSVSVEDVMAFVRFAQDRVGLSDQSAMSESLEKMTQRLDAVSLGNVYRTHSHIRDVARRILLSQKTPPKEQTLATIVETLAERVYAHGHAVELRDAIEIGLIAEAADKDEDPVMWDLLVEYEEAMKLREPVDPATKVAQSDVYSEPAIISMIESDVAVHEFAGQLEVRAKRQMPANMNVNVNLNLTLPANINPAQLTQQAQQVLQQIVQQATQAITPAAMQAVQQALQQQAPLVAVEPAFRNGVWKRSS